MRRTPPATLAVSSDLSWSWRSANYTTDSRGGRAAAPRGNHGGRGGRRAASSTPAADRSFENESRIFGEAGLESSVISSSELGGRLDVPEPPANRRPTRQQRERQEQQVRMRDLARTPVAHYPRVQATVPAESLSHWLSQKGDEALDLLAKFIRLFYK